MPNCQKALFSGINWIDNNNMIRRERVKLQLFPNKSPSKLQMKNLLMYIHFQMTTKVKLHL